MQGYGLENQNIPHFFLLKQKKAIYPFNPAFSQAIAGSFFHL
jgi:hypothetical protein